MHKVYLDTQVLPVPRKGSLDTAVGVLHPTEMEFWVLLQDLLHFLAPLPMRASLSRLHHLESIKYAKPQGVNIGFAFNIDHSNKLPHGSFTALH